MHTPSTVSKSLHIHLVFTIALLIVGCGGSSGGQVPVPSATLGTLRVSSSTPGDASHNANRNGPIEIVFDRELDPSTAQTETVVLQTASGNIPTSLAVAGNKMEVTFSQRLASGTTYLIKAVGLRGKSGETLPDATLLTFTTTTQREWSNPFRLDASGNSSKPYMSFDSNGNAIAAWRQNDGQNGAIYFSKYTREIGWGSPGVLPGASGDVGHIQLANIDDNHVLAVWPRFDACCIGVYSSQYTASTGWDTPKRINSANIAPGYRSPISDPISVSTNRTGTAYVSWNEFTGMTTSVQFRTFSVSQGWSTLSQIDFFNDRMDRGNVSMNSRGEAFATYTIRNDAYGPEGISARAKRYTPDGQWVYVPVHSPLLTEARFPKVVTDEDGNGTITWLQTDTIGKRIHAKRFSAAGLLDSYTVLSGDSGNAQPPNMAIDSSGNVTVAWVQNINGITEIHVSRYTAATGWQPAQVIHTDTKYSGMDSPQVAVDSTGKVVVVWLQYDDARVKVYSRQFSPSRGWEEVRVQSSNGDASTPQIAFGPSGDAAIIWESREGASSKIFITSFN